MKSHIVALFTALALAVTCPTARADSLPGHTATATATVEFLYVGLGDATLIRSPEGNVALIDSGPSDDIVPLLRERGVETIDVVVVTHRHVDHYGGMDAVLKAFTVKQFIENGSPYKSKHYDNLLQMVVDRKIPTSQPSPRPTTISLGSVLLKVLPLPPHSLFGSTVDSTENDRSIGIRVEYGAVSFLLTGDSNRIERAWWKSNVDSSLFAGSTILKLAHHGSWTGTDQSWLDMVNPQTAVVSMGLDVIWRRWSMPAREVVDLLQERRIKLHNTALSGTIGIRTNGHSWEVFKDGSSVPRVSAVRGFRNGLQYAIAGVYFVILLWVFRRWRKVWSHAATCPFFSIGMGLIVLILFRFLGSTFGLPDLFWHDQTEIQFVAGLSAMWLALLLASLARKTAADSSLDPNGPNALEAIHLKADNNSVGIPLISITLPSAFLPVFNGGDNFAFTSLLDHVWLPAGMLVGLLIANSVSSFFGRRHVLPRAGTLTASRIVAVATALALAVTVSLVFTGIARPPAAVSISLLIALLSLALYSTYRMPLRRYLGLVVVLIWMVFTNGRDPYKLQFRDLADYYKPESLVDISYFRGTKDGLRGSTLAKAIAAPGEVTLRPDEELLRRWNEAQRGKSPRPLVVLSVSGGGIAASVWTAMCLDRLIKTIPSFTQSVRVVTGASGGMVAAGYFVAALMPPAAIDGPAIPRESDSDEPAEDVEQVPPSLAPSVDLVGDLSKDVLTPVASHIAIAGLPSLFWPWRVSADRGFVLESTWEKHTRGILATPFSALAEGEYQGWRPSLIVTPMMVEEGRPLVVSNIDFKDSDEMEFFKMFPGARNLRLSSALRMNAAFPLVTPAASLPTTPPRRVVDAGYFDNYGVSTAAAWISTNKNWLMENTAGVVLIQIRAYPLTSEEKENYVASYIERSLHGATSPLEGYAAAKQRAMIERNDSLVSQLQDSFQQKTHRPHFFSTVVFESNEEAALSWSISRADKRRLSASLDSITNAQALERVQILLGAKRGGTGRIVP